MTELSACTESKVHFEKLKCEASPDLTLKDDVGTGRAKMFFSKMFHSKDNNVPFDPFRCQFHITTCRATQCAEFENTIY